MVFTSSVAPVQHASAVRVAETQVPAIDFERLLCRVLAPLVHVVCVVHATDSDTALVRHPLPTALFDSKCLANRGHAVKLLGLPRDIVGHALFVIAFHEHYAADS